MNGTVVGLCCRPSAFAPGWSRSLPAAGVPGARFVPHWSLFGDGPVARAPFRYPVRSSPVPGTGPVPTGPGSVPGRSRAGSASLARDAPVPGPNRSGQVPAGAVTNPSFHADAWNDDAPSGPVPHTDRSSPGPCRNLRSLLHPLFVRGEGPGPFPVRPSP